MVSVCQQHLATESMSVQNGYMVFFTFGVPNFLTVKNFLSRIKIKMGCHC